MVLFLFLTLSPKGFADVHYKVKKGDTLGKISKQHGVHIQALRQANNLPNDVVKFNQLLLIPQKPGKKKAASSPQPKNAKKQTYVVKRGDNLFAIAKRTGQSVGELKRLNHLKGNTLKAGQKLVVAAPIAEKETQKQAEAQVVQVARTVSTNQDDEFDDLDDELEEENSLAAGESVEDVKNASSKPLGTWSSRDEQRLFVRVAMGFLGTPYRFGGQSIRGLDCSAFVKKIYEFFEVHLPRTAREQAFVGMSVPREQLLEGDLVFFNTKRAFGHVGIYIGNNEFLHASYKQKQVKIDSLKTNYYNQRFIKAVRLKEFDEG
jgi:cell wall-associated NlpC family hydrolase